MAGPEVLDQAADLERLWNDLDLEDPGELTVVVEPTRNAWIVVAEWFRRRGTKVVMVPTTQSSDLRKYYSSTPRTIGSTPSSWRGCRCCIPKGCASIQGRGRPIRCAG
ncbi:hypothetical protein MNVM_11910 [Mycobacterium novum]|uniref:Uncharacterized protein n=1 Tax=Mycobacterium novum TaxID=2492438 RepID=A0A7I7JK24_9MYCO|nr:hypothetical protein MNVM_11910 [Mycobacterium novum]